MALKFQIFSKQKVSEWFFKEKKVYEAEKAFDLKKTGWVLGSFVGIALLGVLLWPESNEDKRPQGADAPAGYARPAQQNVTDSDRMNPPGDPVIGHGGIYRGSGGPSNRNRNANQVIRRSAQNSDSIGLIPMGSTIGAKLINSIISANSSSPVIAEIASHDVSRDIPPGSKAIGSAKFDENLKRISIAFHTIVYPDGEQHGAQGVAMMPDGSAGLEGDYSSGEGKRQVGRFMGYFISGLADGMKSRSQEGAFSNSYEPGSVRNGVLNGVAQSAQDQAKQYSDSMGNTTASMSLPAGTEFVLYFEREFNP